MSHVRQGEHQRALKLFQQLDHDCSNSITKSEMLQVMRLHTCTHPYADVRTVLHLQNTLTAVAAA